MMRDTCLTYQLKPTLVSWSCVSILLYDDESKKKQDSHAPRLKSNKRMFSRKLGLQTRPSSFFIAFNAGKGLPYSIYVRYFMVT